MLSWTATYLPSVKKHTRFAIVTESENRVLRIEADASAGTLLHKVSPASRSGISLQWKWRIPRHNPRTDARLKKGDDYPVRLYVLFDYDIAKLSFLDRTRLRLARRLFDDQVPAAALCYIWDPKLAPGTIVPNPFTDRVRMIVVRSGEAGLDQWQEERRDIGTDFETAFGEAAPAVTAIAVAGDGDNTGERTLAYVGDIKLSP